MARALTGLSAAAHLIRAGVSVRAFGEPIESLRRRNASPGRARVGISYRWEHADVRNSLVHLHRARLCSAAAVLRPHMRVVHTHFRIEDPAPLVARMLSMAQKASRGSIRSEAHARATGTISR
jgi:hypothetical protein